MGHRAKITQGNYHNTHPVSNQWTKWLNVLPPTPELAADSLTLPQRFDHGECCLWMGRSSSWCLGAQHPLTCMPSWPEIPIPTSATCIMLTSLAPSPLWNRRKGEKHMRSKEKLPTVQINSGHSNKQINPSKLIPCLQVAWKLAKHKCNVASHCHQEEFHTQHYLKVLHATAPTWTDLPFLYVTHSTFNFPDIPYSFQPCTCCFSILITLSSSPLSHLAGFQGPLRSA